MAAICASFGVAADAPEPAALVPLVEAPLEAAPAASAVMPVPVAAGDVAEVLSETLLPGAAAPGPVPMLLAVPAAPLEPAVPAAAVLASLFIPVLAAVELSAELAPAVGASALRRPQPVTTVLRTAAARRRRVVFRIGVEDFMVLPYEDGIRQPLFH